MVITGMSWANQDPTAPLNWQNPATGSNAKPTEKRYRLPTLNSIVCKESHQCTSILDNQIVEQGEQFKGYRVVSITSEYVTLKQGNRQWQLELFGLNVKK
jgi:MSHA biogenesis protein MshK